MSWCAAFLTPIIFFSFQALVGQLVTLPRLIKDDKKYTVTVDTVSSDRFPPPKRATSYFRADEYYKYIEVAISKQVCGTRKFTCGVFEISPLG